MKLKKLLILAAMATLSVVAISACAKKETAVETPSSAQETVAVEKPDSYGSVKLAEYKGVEVEVNSTAVTDEEVETELNNLLSYSATQQEVTDRAVQTGDIVNIDYTGTKDGVAFDGGTAAGYDLTIGSGSFIDGFEDGLIGANIGDTLNLNLKFPESYHNVDLAGADVVFEVKINSISVEVTPELSDAWVEEYTAGAQKTVAEYKEVLRSDLETAKKQSNEQLAQSLVVEKLLADSEFTVNEAAIEYEYSQAMIQFEQAMTTYGWTLDDYASMMGTDAEGVKAEIRTQAEMRVKQTLLFTTIADKEGIKLTDELYAKFAELQGTTIDDLVANYGQELVDEAALSYAVVTFLYENANIKVAE